MTSIYALASFETSQLLDSLAIPTKAPRRSVRMIPMIATLSVLSAPTRSARAYVFAAEYGIGDSPISNADSFCKNPNPDAIFCFFRLTSVLEVKYQAKRTTKPMTTICEMMARFLGSSQNGIWAGFSTNVITYLPEKMA